MAVITASVVDLSDFQNRREGTVTLPGIPRAGDSFKWDEESNPTLIQLVTWVGGSEGVEVQVG
jgi:hypothetical protein